jgi:hexosaminidase
MHILPAVKKLKIDMGEAAREVYFDYDPTMKPEQYSIVADKTGIRVFSSDKKGKFYAEKTLEQIFYEYKDKIPCFTIEDEPKYSYRGFMMDCCRHFFTVDEIKKEIEVAASVKMNKFHWHLTDDQGWRIEIKKYPLLTEIGSVRKQTRKDGKEVKGYYTAEEIKDIVKFCKERFIDVIPEIDMPGHFTAAIAAYPHLGCTGEKKEVSEHFGIHCEIACAGKETTYGFIKDVLDEVTELFPYEYIHIGGDEALKYRYTECPDCRKKIAEENLADEEALQGYFMNAAIDYLAEKRRKAVLWNDGTLGGNVKGNYAVQYWKETKECKNAAIAAAESGKEIIYSPFSSLYLDYPCGMTPLKKTYNYKEEKELTDRVKGLETPVWTEFIPDIKTWELRAYPRLFAVAERAWSEEKDYDGFLLRLDEYEKFAKENFAIKICEKPDPNKIAGLIETLKFGIKAFDPYFIEFARLTRITKKRMNKRKNS